MPQIGSHRREHGGGLQWEDRATSRPIPMSRTATVDPPTDRRPRHGRRADPLPLLAKRGSARFRPPVARVTARPPTRGHERLVTGATNETHSSHDAPRLARRLAHPRPAGRLCDITPIDSTARSRCRCPSGLALSGPTSRRSGRGRGRAVFRRHTVRSSGAGESSRGSVPRRSPTRPRRASPGHPGRHRRTRRSSRRRLHRVHGGLSSHGTWRGWKPSHLAGGREPPGSTDDVAVAPEVVVSCVGDHRDPGARRRCRGLRSVGGPPG